MKCTQYGLYEQAAFKNARAILSFEVGHSEQGAWATSGQVRKSCPGQGLDHGKCDLAHAIMGQCEI